MLRFIFRRDSRVCLEYEQSFASKIGKGKCLSFASGRMALYELLSIYKIGREDEVIVTGFTCSVVIESIIKTGARPVFVDISIDTLGTCVESVKQHISSKTKAIIVQHSFGIPADILTLKDIAKSKRIKLIEDCAIAYGSKILGKTLGAFGDASIFSTDHSKPMNTIIGGLLYIEDNQDIFQVLEERNRKAFKLSLARRFGVILRICIERMTYSGSLIRAYCRMILGVLYRLRGFSPFFFPFIESGFQNSFKRKIDKTHRLPPELAYLGSMEINIWPVKAEVRIRNARKLYEFLSEYPSVFELPKAIKNDNCYIVPLRVVFLVRDSNLRDRIMELLDKNSIWFTSPIISRKLQLIDYSYNNGDCPTAEMVSQYIINLPVDLSENENVTLINKLRNILNDV
jgi:perosamine synthetase